MMLLDHFLIIRQWHIFLLSSLILIPQVIHNATRPDRARKKNYSLYLMTYLRALYRVQLYFKHRHLIGFQVSSDDQELLYLYGGVFAVIFVIQVSQRY